MLYNSDTNGASIGELTYGRGSMSKKTYLKEYETRRSTVLK